MQNTRLIVCLVLILFLFLILMLIKQVLGITYSTLALSMIMELTMNGFFVVVIVVVVQMFWFSRKGALHLSSQVALSNTINLSSFAVVV